jgi:hypothetical protein
MTPGCTSAWSMNRQAVVDRPRQPAGIDVGDALAMAEQIDV